VVGSTPGLRLSSLATVVPSLVAIDAKVSPDRTVYVRTCFRLWPRARLVFVFDVTVVVGGLA
jgi:hypothetical protein